MISCCRGLLPVFDPAISHSYAVAYRPLWAHNHEMVENEKKLNLAAAGFSSQCSMIRRIQACVVERFGCLI